MLSSGILLYGKILLFSESKKMLYLPQVKGQGATKEIRKFIKAFLRFAK